MDDIEDRFEADPNNFVSIVQYLIRSGQVHILGNDSGREDSDLDDELVAPALPPARPTLQNTENLDKSEFSVLTRLSSGLGDSKKSLKRKRSIAGMVHARERGMPGNTPFTQGDKCKINNSFLPNHKKHLTHLGSKIFCLTFSKDGEYFITASQDRKLRLYKSKQNKYELVKTINAINVNWSILDVAYSPDSQFVAYSSWSECVHICSLHGDPDVHTALMLCPEERRFCVFSLTFSADGKDILCGANDGFIYVYDRECYQQALRIEGHADDVNTVSFADNTSHILYSGGDDGLCKVWDRRTLNETNPKPVGVLAGHLDGITYIESKGDGRHLLSNSKDQKIKLWDVRKFSSQDALNESKKVIEEQNWDYRWQKIPKPLANNKKKLQGDTSVMTFGGHAVLQTLCRCHFSPLETTGQRYIYVGCAAGRVIIYDSLTGKIEGELTGHRACVRDASWHPYKNEILSGSWDGKILQWTYRDQLYEEPNSEDMGSMYTGREPRRRSQRIAERMSRQAQQSLRDDDDDDSDSDDDLMSIRARRSAYF